MAFSAAGSKDPDRHNLTYRWWTYREPGTYTGEIQLANSGSERASLVVPQDAVGSTIHVILEVTDSGTPALTSYRRAVITVAQPPGAL